MRVFKKAMATTMAIAMVCTSITIADTAKVNAATITSIKVLNGKSQTLSVGDSMKVVLKVSPKNMSKQVKYSSSSKKIAKVSSKGVIKAVKPGKATITIKSTNSSKKTKVKVTVAPAKVKNVTAQASGSALKVNWKKQKNVTGYQILASQKKSGGYKVKATVKGAGKSSATINGLAGGTWYVKVKAYKTVGKKKVAGEASSAATAKLWKLVWSDEFNANSLDMNVWQYETGATGWGNQEYQDYTNGQNIKFENGCLVIVPRMEINTATNTRKITSTRINSKNKKSFKYGKIEMRAKSTKGKGTWSAGWMLGQNIDTVGWPRCGEIDILEAMNGGVPQTIHCPYFNNQASAPGGNKNFGTGLTQAQCASDFHTYGIEWTDTYIYFTVDGAVKGRYEPSKYRQISLNDTWTSFKNPFFFIFNCAVGGNAAGEVGTEGWTKVSQNGNVQTYEDYFYVDYVRVYQ